MKLNKFFGHLLEDLHCEKDTNAYIINLFSQYQTAQFDLSNQSITIVFAQARAEHSFLKYQQLSDFIFWCGILYPEHLRFASKDYYETVGRLSYYSCFKLINKQWRCFEELSDRFSDLEVEIKNKLHQSLVISS